MPALRLRLLYSMLALSIAGIVPAHSEPIRVLFRQGETHGFLILRTLDGASLATGELTQTVRGDVVSSKLVFHFRDGSVDEDTTVFTQRGTFRLVRDHHIQRGPSFPKPTDVLIDATAGIITSKAENGELTQEHMNLPADVSNGLPPNLLLNIPLTTAETRVSYVAPGSKPRLVHLTIKPTGTLSLRVGDLRRTATDFTIHVDLGGITGIVAPIVGKEPKDFHIWIMAGVPPAFVREEGQLYEGGPVWRIEQISPALPR